MRTTERANRSGTSAAPGRVRYHHAATAPASRIAGTTGHHPHRRTSTPAPAAAPNPVAAARSANARSRADWNRSPGFFRGSAGRCGRARAAAAADRRQVGRLLVQDRVIVSAGVSAAKRARAREHLVEHAAEREDVGAMSPPARRAPARATCSRPCRARCPASVVGAGVDRARRRPRGWRPSLRQAEVEDLHAAVAVRKMFSGFRSRWTMPFSCAAARPAAICGA